MTTSDSILALLDASPEQVEAVKKEHAALLARARRLEQLLAVMGHAGAARQGVTKHGSGRKVGARSAGWREAAEKAVAARGPMTTAMLTHELKITRDGVGGASPGTALINAIGRGTSPVVYDRITGLWSLRDKAAANGTATTPATT